MNNLRRNIGENGKSGLIRYNLQSIDNFRVSRMVVSTTISQARRLDVHVFSGASECVIAAAAYLKFTDKLRKTFLEFIMGKPKFEPLKYWAWKVHSSSCHRVRRSSDYLKIPQDQFHYYTDSRIVLGYICNRTSRFTQTVCKRFTKFRLRLSGFMTQQTKIHCTCFPRIISENDNEIC